MGCAGQPDAVATACRPAWSSGMVVVMALHRAPLPHAEPAIAAPPVFHPGPLLSQEDFDALVLELDRLRDRHRVEFARSLRDARTYGSPGENDDVLTVFEEAA